MTIVNFPFLIGDVTRSTSYVVYISQLIRFARASSHVADFNTYNKLLAQKLLKQGYQYNKVDGHGCHTTLNFGVKAKDDKDKVPTLYWLPKLHKTL